MYVNNITGDPSACAKVVPLTTGTGGTFDPNALPAFSYIVPNNCNNMHTQSTGTCPAYFGTNPHADKITMADNWLATFVPTITSKATVILTWDEGSATSPQQIITLEYGQGVSSGTNNGSFNHFNLLAGLETSFGVPLIAGAIGKTPLPIGSSTSSAPTITSFTPTAGPIGAHPPAHPIVSVAATPVPYALERSAQTTTARLSLHDPAPSTGLSPVVSEAQQVEGSRRRTVVLRPVESDQPGLLRVQSQTVPLESLRQYFPDSASVFFQREAHDRVVCEPDEEGLTLEPWLHFLFEPHVQHLRHPAHHRRPWRAAAACHAFAADRTRRVAR
jgi:hypothetical protein